MTEENEPKPFNYKIFQKPLPAVHPALERFFRMIDVNDGKITGKELKSTFEVFQGKSFSNTTCNIVARLFDLDGKGGLNLQEFETLYYQIKQLAAAFNACDQTKSGLDKDELMRAFDMLDVKFSENFMGFLIERNGERRIGLDQFIIICLQLQRFTDEFKSRDVDCSGVIKINYEDFLQLILKCF